MPESHLIVSVVNGGSALTIVGLDDKSTWLGGASIGKDFQAIGSG